MRLICFCTSSGLFTQTFPGQAINSGRCQKSNLLCWALCHRCQILPLSQTLNYTHVYGWLTREQIVTLAIKWQLLFILTDVRGTYCIPAPKINPKLKAQFSASKSSRSPVLVAHLYFSPVQWNIRLAVPRNCRNLWRSICRGQVTRPRRSEGTGKRIHRSSTEVGTHHTHSDGEREYIQVAMWGNEGCQVWNMMRFLP